MVRIVLVNLVHEIGWKRFRAESVEQIHPCVQFGASIVVAHSGCVVLNDLNKLAHDLSEEDYARKHENDTNNLLSPRDGIEIPVADRRKRGEGVIANYNSLRRVILYTVLLDPIAVEAVNLTAGLNMGDAVCRFAYFGTAGCEIFIELKSVFKGLPPQFVVA